MNTKLQVNFVAPLNDIVTV